MYIEAVPNSHESFANRVSIVSYPKCFCVRVEKRARVNKVVKINFGSSATVIHGTETRFPCQPHQNSIIVKADVMFRRHSTPLESKTIHVIRALSFI